MRTHTFTVDMRGQPQGSMNAFRRGAFNVVTSANKKLKPFRSEVARCALAYMKGENMIAPFFMWHHPIECHLVFTFVRPKSTNRPHPVVKPDADKLARGVFDALTGSIWADDAQVVSFTCLKRYGAADSVQITVSDYLG